MKLSSIAFCVWLLLLLRVSSSDPPKGFLWDVVIKTCDVANAGTDATVHLKVYYEQGHTQQTFTLDKPSHNDFERNQSDHYRLALSQNDVINVGLFWWPGYTISEGWCVDYIVLLNGQDGRCLLGRFDRWIMHYRDPPTYPDLWGERPFAECVRPTPMHRNLIPQSTLDRSNYRTAEHSDWKRL